MPRKSQSPAGQSSELCQASPEKQGSFSTITPDGRREFKREHLPNRCESKEPEICPVKWNRFPEEMLHISGCGWIFAQSAGWLNSPSDSTMAKTTSERNVMISKVL